MNRELAKFAVYILFPIGTLYVYNRPELHDGPLFRDQNEAIAAFRTTSTSTPDGGSKLPRDMAHVKRTFEEYERRR
ncbi:MAG: hypothetical protein SGCHY_002984 [Lobulomycetales sp.]